jgi:hypothetical protein
MTMVNIYITQFKTLPFNSITAQYTALWNDTLYQQLMSSFDTQNHTMNHGSYKIIQML